MQLRNLTRSMRQHDWVTSTAEFLLLVFGIFIGFQLDRWNDERLQQQEANEYSIALLDDLAIEMQDTEHQIAYSVMVRDFGFLALSAWEEQPQAPAEQLVIAFYQASNIVPKSVSRGAFDALSAKGLMGLVGGPEFASQVSAYYSQDLKGVLSPLVPYRMEVRGILPNKVQMAIRENCTSMASEGLLVETLSTECDIGLSPSHAQALLTTLTNHPRLRFYLTQSISKESVNIYVLQSQQDSIRTLTEKLRTIQAGGS